MGGSVGSTIGRAGLAGITGGLSEFGQKNPFGVPGNPLHDPVNNAAKSLGFNLFGDPLSGDTSQSIPGPFQLNQAQFDADRNAINTEGQKQYGQVNDFITGDAASRDAARSQLAGVLTKQAKDSFAATLPDIAENANAAHLYDSTGYGQEVARQQGQLASGITNQLGLYGINDIANISAQKQAALQGLQGYQQSALGRGLSLEDFVNQANVAKTIGAQNAPQVGNGKGNTGTLLSGVGAAAKGAAALGGK